jgi:hypothetical protein
MPHLLLILLSGLLWPTAHAAEVVAQGTWTRIDYDVQGVWRIEADGDRLTVRLGDDFVTKNGPDLHVLLSPQSLDELTNANAMQGALVAGLLQTNDDSTFFRKMQGAQSFTLPAGTRLADYRTLVIHCVEFSHLWAGAELTTN